MDTMICHHFEIGAIMMVYSIVSHMQHNDLQFYQAMFLGHNGFSSPQKFLSLDF